MCPGLLNHFSSLAFGVDHPELKAFPLAKQGMDRFVITLPHKERGEEDAFIVEIIVGRKMLTDGVNRVRFSNTIEPRQLQGWGYTYYEVTGSSLAMIIPHPLHPSHHRVLVLRPVIATAPGPL